MKKLIEIKHQQTRLLKLTYELGNVCNYKCWYCFPGSNEGTNPFPKASIIKQNLVSLINYYLNSKIVDQVTLVLIGGEPSYWKDLGEVVEYVSQHTKCKILIVTNGSRAIDWWEQYSRYFDHISISVHHESVDIAHIIALTKLLDKQQKASFFADVLMDHTAWDKCINLVDTLIKVRPRVMVTAKPIHINGQMFYDQKQTNYLRNTVKGWPSFKMLYNHFKKLMNISNTEYIFSDGTKIKTKNEHYPILNMLNRFKGWECSLGVNSLTIDRAGNLTGACKQKLFGLDHYFNINDNNFIEKFNPAIKPVICQNTLCLCDGETVLSKKQIYEN